MPEIRINQEKAQDHAGLIKLCPFNAIESSGSELRINAACKMCRICVKKEPEIFEFIESSQSGADKNLWRGIAVYIDHIDGDIHPVSFELIGKARELAAKIKQPVNCLMIGSGIKEQAREALEYGADNVFVYDREELEHFKIEPYTTVLEDFITRTKPAAVLVGGTVFGRSLAPRAAARFRTGLTADCTVLDIQENTDLDQIRPRSGEISWLTSILPNTGRNSRLFATKYFPPRKNRKNMKETWSNAISIRPGCVPTSKCWESIKKKRKPA